MSGSNDWSWRPDRATKEALKKGYRSAAVDKPTPPQKKRAPRPKYSREEMAEVAAAHKASKYL